MTVGSPIGLLLVLTYSTANLLTTDVSTGAPVVPVVPLRQCQVFSAVGVDTGSPVIDVPGIGQVHVMYASPLSTEAPIMGSPVIGQIQALLAGDALAQAFVGRPTLRVVAVVATPDERILLVLREQRVFDIDAEFRKLQVGAEHRTFVIS